MKTIIFINNTYHNYSNERLIGEIMQLEWYCKKNNIEVFKIMIANNEEELIDIKEYLYTNNDLKSGDEVITLEISDISKDNIDIKDFVVSLYDKGILFRAFHEYFNTENEKEKKLLLNCLDTILTFDA